MALVLKDRVKETTTTTGTGTLTLAGAMSGFQAFSVIGNTNTTYYAIYEPSGTAWEVGIGTYTLVGTTLSRDTILASSNSNNAVNFGAGTKVVFCTYPAGKSVYYDASGNVPITGALNVTSASATSFVVGLNGTTNPAFTVDSSTASQAAGFKITGAATGGTVALVATDSGSNTSLTINAKGTGTIGIGSVSTGVVTITPNTVITGTLGIGSTPSAGHNLSVLKNATGATVAIGVFSNSQIQSDVTSAYRAFQATLSTQDAAFTITDSFGFAAFQGTYGASSTVTNQRGFSAGSNLTGATNNYGFYSDIAAGTGRWAFYANGTANNYFAGSIGLGSTTLTAYNLRITKTITGAVTGFGITNESVIQSDVTTQAFGYRTTLGTQAASFTLPNLYHIAAEQGTFGATSTVTSQYGFIAGSNLTGATNNYGFYSNIASGTGRWNFYATGTARNYFNGWVGIQTVADNGGLLEIGGTGNAVSNIGYGVSQYQNVPSTATTLYIYNTTLTSTQAASFTLNDLRGYSVSQGTFGATSAVTNQFGYFVASTLTGATNNYGIYSNIASGTGRWNFYANGTAANYFAGDTGVGSTPTAGYVLTVNKNITGATTAGLIAATGTTQSDVTSLAIGVSTFLQTQAASFTLTTLSHFRANQGTIGATSTVTNQFGVEIPNTLTGATNNFGIYSNIASGTGRWNFYAAGTANNYFAGNVGINVTPTEKLHVSGNFKLTGSINENVFTISDGAAVDLDPNNGTIQVWTLGASRSPTATNFAAGQSMTLMVDDGSAYTITWPSVTWRNNAGAAPTLATTGYTVIALWKVSTTLYGALVGNGT